MNIIYHQATLTYLNIVPFQHVEAIHALDALEAQYSVQVPLAVREWYSINLPEEHRWAFPLEMVNQPHPGMQSKKFSLDRGFLLLLSLSEDSLYQWFVELNSDDPPVWLVNRHTGDEERTALLFSEFVFRYYWDAMFEDSVRYPIIAHLGQPVSEMSLNLLKTTFRPITLKSDSHLRFQSGALQVLIEQQPFDTDSLQEWASASQEVILRMYVPGVQEAHHLLSKLWADLHHAEMLYCLSATDNDISGLIDWMRGDYAYQLIAGYDTFSDSAMQDLFTALRTHFEDLTKFMTFGQPDKIVQIQGSNRHNENVVFPQRRFLVRRETQDSLHWRFMARSAYDLIELIKTVSKVAPVTLHLSIESFAPNFEDMQLILMQIQSMDR